jgi:hypothetical protein
MAQKGVASLQLYHKQDKNPYLSLKLQLAKGKNPFWNPLKKRQIFV